MTHAEIVAVIERHGGRLVASFDLDADGQTVGARRDRNRTNTCGACGEPGHTIRRCRGTGEAPRPTHEERRRDESRRILAERSAARTESRRRR